MVKGISKQVILVHSPDPELFEQAIFILKDGAKMMSDEALLQEAKSLLKAPKPRKQNKILVSSLFWCCCGAFASSLLWLLFL